MSITKREAKIGVKFGSETEKDISLQWGIYLLESPKMPTAPLRDYDVIEYPESTAVEIDARTRAMAFDYELSLFCFGDELTANAKIKSFFDYFFTADANGILTAKKILLKNYYTLKQMSGYAKKWDGDKTAFQDDKDVWGFKFTLYVDDGSTYVDLALS